MATSIGQFFMELFMVDKLTPQLKAVGSITKDTTEKLSEASTSFLKLGATFGGVGMALGRVAPGMEEFGRIITGAGAAVGALSAVMEAPEAIMRFATSIQAVQKSMEAARAGFVSYNAMLAASSAAGKSSAVGSIAASAGITTLSGAVGFLMTVLVPILPIILAIAAAAFILYTAWTENFGGIQAIVMGVFGDISAFVFDVVEFMKGVIIGFFEATRPVWTLLGIILKGVGAAFRALSTSMRGTEGSFNRGRKMVYAFMPVLLVIKGLVWALTPIFRLLGNTIDKAFGKGSAVKLLLSMLFPIYGVIKGLQKLWEMFGDSIVAAFEKVWEALAPIIEPIEAVIGKIKELIDWYSNLGKEQEEIAGAPGIGGGMTGYGDMGGSPSMGIYGAVPNEAIPGKGSSSVDARQISVSAQVTTGPISSGVDVDMMSALTAKKMRAELESIP